MYKRLFSLLILFFLLVLSFLPVGATGMGNKDPMKVNAYLFHSNSCAHCKNELKYFENLGEEQKEKFNLYKFEIRENGDLFNKVAEGIGQTSMYVPYLVIGDEVIVGFGDNDTTGVEIVNRINHCYLHGCRDSVANIVGVENENVIVDNKDKDKDEDKLDLRDEKLIELPILGEVVNVKGYSLPVAAVILGFVDGFNPCAMWVLFFLITLLIEVKSFWKRLYLGALFILASGAVYFAALLGWNLIFSVLHNIVWMKLLVIVIAFASGVNLLKKFFERDNTCKIVNVEQRQTIFSRLKKVVDSKNILYASILLIIVAFSVNLIELACSLGLPVVFADLLESRGVSQIEKLGLILIYIFFYMLDDLIVFVVSMITLEATGLGKKYMNFIYLVGGILMLIIGGNLLISL